MEERLGRLIDHIHIRSQHFAASKEFYRAILAALGRSFTREDDHFFSADELYVDASDVYQSKIHLAFQAADHEAVQRFHAAGLAHGGRDNGAPGERDYHPGYYACFLLDPDGNNIEAVYHGPTTRSAADVVVTRSAV